MSEDREAIRESILEATLAHWRSAPFAWGTDDCMMGVFDYCRALTGIDGGAEWRGTYHDEDSALAVLAAAAGGRAGLARGMGIVGAREVQEPMRGDVVCIRIGGQEVGGLAIGDGAAEFRLERGSIEIALRLVDLVGAWRP